MDTTMRRAGSADAAAIRTMVRRAYAQWVPVIGREPRPMLADYDRAVTAHAVHLVEEAGVMLALIELVPAGDHLLIENIAVAPEARGRGLGTRLLAFAEAEARRLGVPEIRLYTNALMSTNRALYARRGYTETSVEQVGPYTVVNMAKRVG